MPSMGAESSSVAGAPTPSRDIPAEWPKGLWPRTAQGTDRAVSWRWLAGLTVLGLILRGIALNQQLWFDEIVLVVTSARQSFWQIVTTYDWQNQHMLYSILSHFSIRFLGDQPWALRLPAVLFGVATIPALYFFARPVTTERESLLAAALMTVSYHHVWFSQNARGYTAIAFWTLLTSIYFIRGAHGGKTRDWILYGIFGALGIYTHLTMAFIIGGHAVVYIWLLVSRRETLGHLPERPFLPLYGFVLAGLIPALLYAPILTRIFARTIGVAGTTARSDWANPIWAFWEMVRGLGAGAAGGLLAVALGGVVFFSGLLSCWRRDRFVIGLIVLPGILTTAAILATSHNLWPRFFFFEIGFGFLLLVRGLMVWGEIGVRLFRGTERRELQLGTALSLLAVLASLPLLRAAYLYPKQDFQGAMKFVEEQRKPGEPVVTIAVVTMPFQRYYGRSWPNVESPADLDAARKGDQATWLIYAMPIYVRATYPDLWAEIQNDFMMVRVFGGTLSGGEIYVCKSKNRSGANASAR